MHVVKPDAFIEPQAIGELLRAISDHQGYFVTKCALRLASDIQYLLGYTKWDNFLNVVSKARAS